MYGQDLCDRFKAIRMASVTQNLKEQDDVLSLIFSDSLCKEGLDGLLGENEGLRSPFLIRKCAEDFEVI